MPHGFLTQQMLQILRGPGPTKIKEWVDVGRAEKYGEKVEGFYDEMVDMLEKKHTVSVFLTKFLHFLDYVKKSGNNAFKIFFNQLTQDLTQEREQEKLINDIRQHLRDLPPKCRSILEYYLQKAFKTIESQEHTQRKQYWAVASLMKELSKVADDKEALMVKLRTMMKEKNQFTRVLERFAWRREIAASRREIGNTVFFKKRINATLDRLNAAMQQLNKHVGESPNNALSKELRSELEQVTESIAKMFNASYLVKERALLFVMKIVYIAENVDEKVVEEVAKNYAPDASVEEIRKKLAEVLRLLGQEFHNVIEQGFRISINHLQKEEKQIQQEIREIESQPRAA